LETVTFKLLDTVVLNKDLPGHRLKQGDVGAIVEAPEPDVLEVEFVAASGKTIALVTVPALDVRSPMPGEMLAVRPV
jgi:hypothetical protein